MDFFHRSKQTNIHQATGTKVKICGIRRIDSAIAAIRAGANFLGFNFVNSSPRYINPMKAREIIHQVHKQVTVVGVFQNMHHHEVNELANFLKLDFIQLHGDEDEHYIEHVKKSVIKAVNLYDNLTHEEKLMSMRQFSVNYFLLDKSKTGETVDIIDVDRAAQIAQELPIFLAGGLTPENVADIVAKVRPYAVDVAGGIESNGHEDLDKITRFVRNAKGISL